MSEQRETGANGADPHPEETRNLPVLAPPVAEATPVARPASSTVPAPMAAATGGFLAGFLTFTLMRVMRRRGRPTPRIALRRKRRGEALEITGSRSFLVDVHLLNKR